MTTLVSKLHTRSKDEISIIRKVVDKSKDSKLPKQDNVRPIIIDGNNVGYYDHRRVCKFDEENKRYQKTFLFSNILAVVEQVKLLGATDIKIFLNPAPLKYQNSEENKKICKGAIILNEEFFMTQALDSFL